MFDTEGEHSSAGDRHIENMRLTSATHTQTAIYQQLPSKANIEIITSHSYIAPLKMGVIMLRRP